MQAALPIIQAMFQVGGPTIATAAATGAGAGIVGMRYKTQLNVNALNDLSVVNTSYNKAVTGETSMPKVQSAPKTQSAPLEPATLSQSNNNPVDITKNPQAVEFKHHIENTHNTTTTHAARDGVSINPGGFIEAPVRAVADAMGDSIASFFGSNNHNRGIPYPSPEEQLARMDAQKWEKSFLHAIGHPRGRIINGDIPIKEAQAIVNDYNAGRITLGEAAYLWDRAKVNSAQQNFGFKVDKNGNPIGLNLNNEKPTNPRIAAREAAKAAKAASKVPQETNGVGVSTLQSTGKAGAAPSTTTTTGTATATNTIGEKSTVQMFEILNLKAATPPTSATATKDIAPAIRPGITNVDSKSVSAPIAAPVSKSIIKGDTAWEKTKFIAGNIDMEAANATVIAFQIADVLLDDDGPVDRLSGKVGIFAATTCGLAVGIPTAIGAIFPPSAPAMEPFVQAGCAYCANVAAPLFASATVVHQVDKIGIHLENVAQEQREAAAKIEQNLQAQQRLQKQQADLIKQREIRAKMHQQLQKVRETLAEAQKIHESSAIESEENKIGSESKRPVKSLKIPFIANTIKIPNPTEHKSLPKLPKITPLIFIPVYLQSKPLISVPPLTEPAKDYCARETLAETVARLKKEKEQQGGSTGGGDKEPDDEDERKKRLLQLGGTAFGPKIAKEVRKAVKKYLSNGSQHPSSPPHGGAAQPHTPASKSPHAGTAHTQPHTTAPAKPGNKNKGGKSNNLPRIIQPKYTNMHELAAKEPFGKLLINNIEKIKGAEYKGRQGYRLINDMKDFGIKRGDKLYLDSLHGDHIEVFKAGPKGSLPQQVISVDGRILLEKLAKAKAEKRICPF
jgi:hypothetical protein